MDDKQIRPLEPEELVDMYAGVIYRIAYSRLQNVPDAEDITQEVLLKYIKSDKSFNDEDHRRMWIIRVTVNAVNSLMSSSWRRRLVPLEEADAVSYTEPEQYGVREAMKRLPEKYRIPIHLYYFENMTINQIAAALNRKEGTVKSLLSRGRNKLRALLEEEDHV